MGIAGSNDVFYTSQPLVDAFGFRLQAPLTARLDFSHR